MKWRHVAWVGMPSQLFFALVLLLKTQLKNTFFWLKWLSPRQHRANLFRSFVALCWFRSFSFFWGFGQQLVPAVFHRNPPREQESWTVTKSSVIMGLIMKMLSTGSWQNGYRMWIIIEIVIISKATECSIFSIRNKHLFHLQLNENDYKCASVCEGNNTSVSFSLEE